MLVKKRRLIGEEIASIKRKKRFVKKYKRNEDYIQRIVNLLVRGQQRE